MCDPARGGAVAPIEPVNVHVNAVAIGLVVVVVVAGALGNPGDGLIDVGRSPIALAAGVMPSGQQLRRIRYQVWPVRRPMFLSHELARSCSRARDVPRLPAQGRRQQRTTNSIPSYPNPTKQPDALATRRTHSRREAPRDHREPLQDRSFESPSFARTATPVAVDQRQPYTGPRHLWRVATRGTWRSTRRWSSGCSPVQQRVVSRRWCGAVGSRGRP